MNSAAIPIPQGVISDPYVWRERHEAVIEANRRLNPGIVLLGDSITHYWGGVPEHEIRRGPDSYDALYAPLRAVNMGFGMDMTQHLLWRIRNGELDSISPSLAQILIGTNNLTANTNAEIAEGVEAVVRETAARLPAARIVLLGILPREGFMDRIDPLNDLLAALPSVADGTAEFHNPARGIFASPDGTIDLSLYGDAGTHPNAEGYRRLARALAECAYGRTARPAATDANA